LTRAAPDIEQDQIPARAIAAFRVQAPGARPAAMMLHAHFVRQAALV